MSETKTEYRFSPDRLKLLWLLLRKRGIDFPPQQISPSEHAAGQKKGRPEPGPVKRSHQAPTPPDEENE
jgi:hypothetical protein